jgi:class 3 adenylate cyclase
MGRVEFGVESPRSCAQGGISGRSPACRVFSVAGCWASGAAHVRIGIASGEPVERHGDIFGSTAQMAARLCSCTEAGQILVSNVVTELCVGKKFRFQDLGELTLKGFDCPVRAHAVARPDETKL